MKHAVYSDVTQPGASVPRLIVDKLADFDASLQTKVKVPPERIVEFLCCSDVDLEQQIRIAVRVERRLKALLNRVERESASVGEYLDALDLRVFSRDHDWRGIVGEVAKRSPDSDVLKGLVLRRYLEYLRFRKQLLSFILERRFKRPHSKVEELQLRDSGEFNSDQADLKETDIFQRPARLLHSMASDKFVRLPKDETVAVSLGTAKPMTLFLASHRFALFLMDGELRLEDENGVSYFLAHGNSTIGRHGKNDVVIDFDFKEISRYHLIVAWHGGEVAQLTDISTLGTFALPECLNARARG